jgi:hypothetical protein
MAPILSHGQTTSGQCGFNQVASHPADPMKRHRARRERSHPKAMLNTQTSAVALDLLENSIGGKWSFAQAAGMASVYTDRVWIWGRAELGENFGEAASCRACVGGDHQRDFCVGD